MKKIEWNGFYYDGQSAKRHEVKIKRLLDGLEIRQSNMKPVFWSYEDITRNKELQSKNQTFLENLELPNQKIIINDPHFFEELKELLPKNRLKGNYGITNNKLRLVAFICLFLIPLFTLGYYFFILPSSSEYIAKKIPVSFEKTLAAPYFNLLIKDESSCEKEQSYKDIELLLNKLTATIPETRYNLKLHVIKSDIVNAFALPGGDIVVYSGLLEKTTRPEQLAGVLAHEIQHVINRHGTEALIKDYSLSLLISALTGNTNNSSSTLALVKTIGMLKNSRTNEKEADIEGLKMLRDAKIDPKGMVEFFEIMKESSGDISKSMEYISTHPQTSSRINDLEKEISTLSYNSETLFTEKQWERIKKVCDNEDIKQFKLF